MKIDKLNLDGKKDSIEVLDKIFSAKINKKLVGGADGDVGVEFYSSDPCAYVNFPRKHANVNDAELLRSRNNFVKTCNEEPPLKRWSANDIEEYWDRMRQEAVGRGEIWRLLY